MDTDSNKTSIHMTRDHDKNKRRRRAWDRGFAIKGTYVPAIAINGIPPLTRIDSALNTYQPIIKAKVDEFIAQISKLETVDATAWSMYLSFDIMGKVGLGKDFYCVTEGVEHPGETSPADRVSPLDTDPSRK